MVRELGCRLEELTALAREDPSAAVALARRNGTSDTARQAQHDDADDARVQARLAALMLGAALAAVDDYEACVRSGITEPVPAAGDLETDRRRWLGIAIGKLETVRSILSEAALEPDRDLRLWALSREASRLAYTTVYDLIVHASGSGSDARRLVSIVSVMARLWGQESGAHDEQVLRRLARERLDA